MSPQFHPQMTPLAQLTLPRLDLRHLRIFFFAPRSTIRPWPAAGPGHRRILSDSRRSGFLSLEQVTLGILLVSAVGCGTANRQTYHRVQRGETLYRISKSYGTTVDAIASANQIANPERIEVGQRLVIPDATAAPTRAPARRRAVSPEQERRDQAALALSWPIDGGVVTSGFGQRKGTQHDGIDVSAPPGTPVLAAQDGEVIFSDVLRGYGNLVIVRHSNGFSTVYAHNQVNLVRQGQRVRRGDTIARVGSTGHTSGANLHFEVRRDNVARNPASFLPPSQQVAIRDDDSDS